MNIWDILILLAIAGILILAWQAGKKRPGSCSCGGCSGCSGCTAPCSRKADCPDGRRDGECRKSVKDGTGEGKTE